MALRGVTDSLPALESALADEAPCQREHPPTTSQSIQARLIPAT